jgi:hypothetical protein
VVALGIAAAATGPAAGTHGGTHTIKYPDLKTLRPSNLSFDRVAWSDGTTHWVLRFDNTVWNAGQGRLELEGNPRPRKKNAPIYQNLYDAPVGGSHVSHKQISTDILYHSGHRHYRFQNFASYLLLQKDAGGVYQATTKKGTKTSFCIMDTGRVSGSYSGQYTICGQTLQGLTVGWGDTYGAYLAEQWIDLGTGPLANGTYAVQSTADPANKLAESNDGNNVATTCFTVSSGAITVIAC